jgi:hypothetical protein
VVEVWIWGLRFGGIVTNEKVIQRDGVQMDWGNPNPNHLNLNHNLNPNLVVHATNTLSEEDHGTLRVSSMVRGLDGGLLRGLVSGFVRELVGGLVRGLVRGSEIRW